ncbi:MAG: GntR family transcriptional regulator [Amphiplicatus sp.]
MYRTLMNRVLAGGFSPGARIDVNEIAAVDGVSPTPVRNALNRLVGAGLLVSHSNEGFFAPILSEQDLRDLYDSSGALLGLAIARGANARPPPKPAAVDHAYADETIERRAEEAFRDIMRLCGNAMLCAALADISLRLRPARVRESDVIVNLGAELRRILRAYEAADFTELDRLIGAYHRRRIRLAPKIHAQMRHRDSCPVRAAVQATGASAL